jgi:periplasmic protein TonB
MLGYAARRRVPAARQSSPQAMLLVISAHIALIAVVMSARMEFPSRMKPDITKIDFVPPPVTPPTQERVKQRNEAQIRDSQVAPDAHVRTQPLGGQPVETGGLSADPGPIAFGGASAFPDIPGPAIIQVRHEPRLLTRPDELRPPYPQSKILSEEEAVLTLRLTIDDRGRVVQVQPVGRADPVFLAAARRHLIAHWRYQPAREDGNPIASSLVITLHFQLDG